MPVRKIKQMVIDPEDKQHLWYASFRTFHYENPQILQMILEQLDKAMEKGMTKVSIKTIIGYLRWDVTLQIKGDYEFKINDAYTSLYSELIAKNWPEYGHMFEQRIFRSIAKQNTTDGK